MRTPQNILQVNGLVVAVVDYGEKDRVLTILTSEMGLVSVLLLPDPAAGTAPSASRLPQVASADSKRNEIPPACDLFTDPRDAGWIGHSFHRLGLFGNALIKLREEVEYVSYRRTRG